MPPPNRSRFRTRSPRNPGVAMTAPHADRPSQQAGASTPVPRPGDRERPLSGSAAHGSVPAQAVGPSGGLPPGSGTPLPAKRGRWIGFVGILALLVALASLAVAWRAVDQARDARDIALRAVGDPAAPPAPVPP